MVTWTMTSHGPERSSRDPNKLKAQFLESSWRCHLATIANYQIVCGEAILATAWLLVTIITHTGCLAVSWRARWRCPAGSSWAPAPRLLHWNYTGRPLSTAAFPLQTLRAALSTITPTPPVSSESDIHEERRDVQLTCLIVPILTKNNANADHTFLC